MDAWQFTEAGAASIENVNTSNVRSQTPTRYDLSGRRLTDSQQHQGIVIEQYTDENGVKHCRKLVE